MKAINAGFAALLLLAGACHHHEDTGAGGVWGRTVEPRLTMTRSWHSCTRKLSPGHVVAGAQCDAAPVLGGRCDDVIGSREEADRVLVARPQCTNAAIASLENFSRVDAAAMSDLAGAYYVRAQRNDNPADLLSAFDAARRAVALTPRPTGAEFNFALILEALSLNDDAIEAWQSAAASEQGEWAEEARAHRAALLRARAEDGEHQWPRVQAQIDAALDAHNAGETRRLIAAFPATSQKHFEEDVLPQWADSPSPQQLARVTTFAEALSQFFNDRYFADVGAAIVNARSRSTIDRLREGHRRFARARAAERTLKPKTAVPLYEEAAQLLRQAGSPQWLLARIACAGQKPFLTDDYEASLRELKAIDVEARLRRYPTVIARVALGRTYPDQYLDRYGDLFASYDAAKTAYDANGDWEDSVSADARGISAMSVVGLKDAAWRDAFSDLRLAPRVLNSKTRHLLVGVAATAALDLGHPEAGLRYHTVIVNLAATMPPAYLASALSHRAAIELRLQQYANAQADVEKASRLSIDPSVRSALEARLDQVEGEAALPVDPVRAVATLTKAIALASTTEYTTFRAMLFAQRAEAFRRMGRRPQAEADMGEALKQLHAEEERQLREMPDQDDLWNVYFSRFEETYDLLIRQLVEEHRAEEAFRYADRARAFEPLDLVRRLPTAPVEFRALAADPDHLDIAKLRAYLPLGTYLIEYRVLEDQTYAWIVSRDVFTVQPLTARRRDVNRWTAALQDAARIGDGPAFEDGLYAPYDALLKKPLDYINRASGASGANIVIVPDRELRGLPFAALRDPETKRYVIEDHALTSSGSALLYVFAVLRDRDLRQRDASALLIGDPAFDPQFTLARGLQRLQGARQEVDAIRLLYSPADVLTAEAATASQFLRMANGHAIIHIAAHAIVNGDAPSQSFLLFTPSGAEHGVLNAATLIKELHADTTRLVVLGACSSAGGLPVGAEGIAPLVRPIIGAGVPGVIGALWDIEDATAAELLVSFHRHYRQGNDAAAALRAAQLELLRSSTPGLRSGLKWAPFQAIGYASSPFASMGDIKKEKPP
jgi:CHAT domain-containing protein